MKLKLEMLIFNFWVISNDNIYEQDAAEVYSVYANLKNQSFIQPNDKATYKLLEYSCSYQEAT